jgi:hypothetical protein
MNVVLSAQELMGDYVQQNNYFRNTGCQKWYTNGALRCRRDYRKRQKNVKKFYWTYLLIWRSLKVALNRSIILKYVYEIVMTATSNCTIASIKFW